MKLLYAAVFIAGLLALFYFLNAQGLMVTKSIRALSDKPRAADLYACAGS